MIDLLLTRPLAQARDFAVEVEQACPGQYTPMFWPLIEIETTHVALDLEGVQALLFTSANAVRTFAEVSDRRDLPALCVGDASAAAARSVGLTAMSARGDADALAALAATVYRAGAGDYLHLRGRDTAGDLAGALRGQGITVREAILYTARPAARIPEAVAASLARGLGAVTLFSPRTARIFAGFAREAVAAGTPWRLHSATAVAISQAAGAPVATLGFGRLLVAKRPESGAMCDALAQIVSDRPLHGG